MAENLQNTQLAAEETEIDSPIIPQEALVDPFQTQPNIKPATVENQLETEAAQNLDAAASQQELLTGRRPDDLETKQLMLQKAFDEQQVAQAESEAAQSAAQESAKAEFQAMEQKAASLEESINQATALGQDPSDFQVALDSLRAKQAELQATLGLPPQESPAESILQADAIQDPSQPADVQDRNLASEAAIPTQNEVAARALELKNQEIEIEAQQQAQAEKFAEQQKLIDDSIAKLQSENEALEAIDPERFWNSRSTGQKILAGIGLLLGGSDSVQMLQTAINNDIKAQKLNRQQELAHRQHALKIVQNQMSDMQNRTANEFKKQKLEMAKQKLALEVAQLNQERLQISQQESQKALLGQKLASPEGLTREEVLSLDPKLQERMIFFKDGKARPATSKGSRDKLVEQMGAGEEALEGLARLEEIGETSFLGGSINPLTKSEAATIKQSLIGALRLKLFGPGVLSLQELELANKIIGDPTKIMGFNVLELKKIRTLQDKLKYGVKQRLKKDGIELPPSENDKNIARLMEAGLSKKAAIDTLNRSNKWKTESEF